MTRILQVLGHASGGIAVHAADLARGLREAGENVLVVAPPDTLERFSFGSSRAMPWPSPRRPLASWRGLRALRTLVRGSDVVHAHGHQAGALACLAALGTGVPVIVSWHNTVLAQRGIGALAERFQARRAALVTGASGDLVERAREVGARSAQLAPVAAPAAGSWRGGAEAARSGLLGQGPDTQPREVWILTVSRFAPQKDLPTLVAAARLLAAREDLPPWRWILVGDGDDDIAAQVRTAARDLPLEMVGAREDVPRWMAASDLLVVTSRWEARALVVQEALGAGLPVVATDVGGLPELVTGNGLLVPVGDPRATAAAVAHLVADGAHRAALSARARQRFAELPGPAQVSAAWRERYAGVLAS
ncbi:glycosyltransferase family 4 protein [Serinibacter salmoneus]|uniref:Glycosyltransferase involved in cell wall biosynthesis n=1 Tax=Serinibacter salmoneus TaxID=556530 RepID=A0A2A9CZM5_9MICO|nr:glycosyltransferase family 4 protein [Serinibacter salmoneus]PFG19455.1 glycosyltransferase involved in cell wall biosynthesis [Serinibacter salmoneus]